MIVIIFCPKRWSRNCTLLHLFLSILSILHFHFSYIKILNMSNYTLTEESPPNTDPEEIGYTSTFWIGLGVSVITNLVQAFALSFQRKSHLLNDLLPRELRRNAYKRPMWLFAFLSFIFANTIGSIFSIGYLPIVILAPIGAMNLVFNAFAANIVLGDPLSKQSILGIYLYSIFVAIFVYVCIYYYNQEPDLLH